MYIMKFGTYITRYTAYTSQDIEYIKLHDFRRKQRLTRYIGMKLMTIFINFEMRRKRIGFLGVLATNPGQTHLRSSCDLKLRIGN